MRTQFSAKKSRETFGQILTVATRLFREKGFAATTLREIARETGMSLGALYYYFASKEEIILRFYEREAQDAGEAFVPKLEELPTRLPEAMAEFLRWRLTLLTPHRELLRVALKEGADRDSPLCPFHPASRVALDTNLAMHRAILERTTRFRDTEATDWTRVLWLAQMGLLVYWLYEREPDYRWTNRAIDLWTQALGLLVAVHRFPGAGALFTQFFPLMTPLFEETENPDDSKT